MNLAVLVLHGPNLAALAREHLDARLQTRAAALGVTLTIAQANGEEGLLDVLHEAAASHDAVLVNPGVIAPHAFALAEGLAQVGLPTVEVVLTKPRARSALGGVVLRQVHGEGVDGYVRALEQVVGDAAPTRSGGAVGKKPKTIGRRGGKSQQRAAPRAAGVTRAQVRERIEGRLRGDVTPAELTGWARETWAALQDGAAAEAGFEAVIDSVLLALMTPRTDDAGLISLMARLDT